MAKPVRPVTRTWRNWQTRTFEGRVGDLVSSNLIVRTKALKPDGFGAFFCDFLPAAFSSQRGLQSGKNLFCVCWLSTGFVALLAPGPP